MPKRFGVNSGRALTDYLALGPERSLRLLRQLYLADPTVARPVPSLSTLGKWSKRDGWDMEAGRHDGLIKDETRAALIRETVADRVDVARGFMQLSHEALSRATEALKSRVQYTSKVGDLKTLVDLAVQAAKQGDVMAGGVSDRTGTEKPPEHEHGKSFTDPTLRTLIEKHEQEQADKATSAAEKGIPATTADGKPVH